MKAQKTDTAANQEQPPEGRGLDQGRAEREREKGAEENEKDPKPGAPVRSKQVANPPRAGKPRTPRKTHGQHAQGATRPPTGKPPEEGSRADEGAGAKPDPHRRARGEAEAQQQRREEKTCERAGLQGKRLGQSGWRPQPHKSADHREEKGSAADKKRTTAYTANRENIPEQPKNGD